MITYNKIEILHSVVCLISQSSTRFDEIFRSLGQLFCYWANFHCCLGQILSKQTIHLVTLLNRDKWFLIF